MMPLLNSIVGLLAVLSGGGALLLMLELRGNSHDDKEVKQRLLRAHRLSGWFCAALLLALSSLMLIKAGGYRHEFPPRLLLHIALGLLLLPLLTVKILLIRRFKRLGTMTLSLGIILFFILFLLYSLTGGYYFLHLPSLRQVALDEQDALDVDLGRQLMTEKCAKCHSLERIFKAVKNKPGWTKTVNRMAALDTPNIRDFEAKQIIHYLIIQQERRQRHALAQAEAASRIGKALVSQKCALCHPLERTYKAKKTEAEWMETVGRMMRHADDPDFLGKDETEAVVSFLSGRADKGEEK